jgi:hypothetical protein
MKDALRWMLGLGLAAGVGFAAARGLAPAGGEQELLQQLRRLDERLEALESRGVPPPPSGPCAVAVDTEALRLQLRQTLREELGALRGPAAPPPVAATVPVPTPTPAPTPENMEAFDKGQRLVEEAISSRRWGDAQADELRRLLGAMTPEQRSRIFGRLLPAINQQQISVETRGPPL